MYRKEDLPPGQEGRIGIGLQQEDGSTLWFDMSGTPPATITAVGESTKIPKLDYWSHRYGVYRQLYGRPRSFWKAVVLTELAFIGPQWLRRWAFERIKKDELRFLGVKEGT